MKGERIYIPQHAGGRAKELAIESSDSGDPEGLCEVHGFTQGCTSDAYLDIGYQCDTEGGSSGSPVLATSSHKVIGLHHCANCPNRAVPINLICDEICPILQPCVLPDDDLLLLDDIVTSDEMQESCSSITTGPNYSVSAGGYLTLHTRDWMVLNEGTVVAAGGELRIDLDPTTGSI